MAGAELARSATEQPHVDMDHKHRIATERSLADGHMLDSEIVLRKDPETDPTAVRVKTHHDRAPDVGIGILISIPRYRAGAESPEIIEYYVEIAKLHVLKKRIKVMGKYFQPKPEDEKLMKKLKSFKG